LAVASRSATDCVCVCSGSGRSEPEGTTPAAFAGNGRSPDFFLRLDGLAMRFISDRGDLPMIVPGRINTHLTAVICEMTTR